MKFENTTVTGFENAIIDMHLPMCKDFNKAKEKCDSKIGWNSDFSQWGVQKLGEKDLDLMKRLINADENAFLRMIHVQVTITAPLYFWKQLVINLPESWLQTRMFDCNYSTLRNIYHQHKNHKLSEWHVFCDWIKSLPLAEELLINPADKKIC